MALKEYDGFPKTLQKGEEGRVANTPTDQVNLEARGYKVVEQAGEAYSGSQDEQGGADEASALKQAATEAEADKNAAEARQVTAKPAVPKPAAPKQNS